MDECARSFCARALARARGVGGGTWRCGSEALSPREGAMRAEVLLDILRTGAGFAGARELDEGAETGGSCGCAAADEVASCIRAAMRAEGGPSTSTAGEPSGGMPRALSAGIARGVAKPYRVAPNAPGT